jgi:hypothetical protein
MSDQFFYLQFNFRPKSGTLTSPITGQHHVTVEIPKDLVRSKQASLLNENLTEKEIAIDLARRVALGTFPTVAEPNIGLYDEGPPIWCEDRPHVINERPCDNEENGTRAWRIMALEP